MLKTSDYGLSLVIMFALILLTSICSSSIVALSNDEWYYEIKYSYSDHLEVRSEPAENSSLIGKLSYLDKVLLVVDVNNDLAFGWDMIVYPVRGYVKSDKLITTDLSRIQNAKLYEIVEEQNKYSNWDASVLYCEPEFSFVKKDHNFSSETIGIIQKNEKVLFVKKEGESKKVWLNILYPVEGYVSATEYSESGGDVILSLGFSYSPLNLPYEKNMENYKNPIGGILEFSKTNWNLAFRFGFQIGQTNLNTYILKTQHYYFLMRWTFLRMFEKKLGVYAFAGGSYWLSKFQNTKYPALTEYYPEEEDEDLGYNAGCGLVYHMGSFFLDVQYMFWGSREAKFGKEPESGEFTNLYKLFPGANLINVVLGYSYVF